MVKNISNFGFKVEKLLLFARRGEFGLLNFKEADDTSIEYSGYEYLLIGKKIAEISEINVENNDLCVSNGLLSNYDKGTVKLVKTALYVIKTEFPEITTLTLKDDSQIYCEKGSKIFKISMSYDYIL